MPEVISIVLESLVESATGIFVLMSFAWKLNDGRGRFVKDGRVSLNLDLNEQAIVIVNEHARLHWFWD